VRDLDPTGAAGSLAAAIRAIARGGSLDAALDVVLRSVVDDVGAALALIVAAGEDRSQRHVVRSLGLAEGDVASIESAAADMADPIAVAMAEQQATEAVAAGTGEPGSRSTGEPGRRSTGALTDRLGLARLRALPLVLMRGGIDHVVGVLAVGWTAETPGVSGTPGLVDGLADLAALEIDRSHLAAGMAERAEWMERLAHIDPLTGLANRRTFDRVLELELARAARQQSEVAVAVFDVDAFRATNDAIGHAAGDDVLRAVAAVLAEQVRFVDTVARIGGDEFVVIAPGSGGLAVADRVIRAIQVLPPVGGRPVSVSAGVARFPLDGGSADEVVAGALDALELARAGGRGAVASAPAVG
jgi:diguanylate cyclase (GGDEF)-like protein